MIFVRMHLSRFCYVEIYSRYSIFSFLQKTKRECRADQEPKMPIRFCHSRCHFCPSSKHKDKILSLTVSFLSVFKAQGLISAAKVHKLVAFTTNDINTRPGCHHAFTTKVCVFIKTTETLADLMLHCNTCKQPVNKKPTKSNETPRINQLESNYV